MKRFFLIITLFCGIVIVLQRCSPKTKTSSDVAAKKGDVTGNWVLNNITFDGIPDVSVRSYLGESSYKCFIGSVWNLTNSGNGSYTFAEDSVCGSKTQKIFWSVIPDEKTFQYKILNAGDKASGVTEGYKLVLASADGKNMILKSPVNYGNKTAYIVMNFSKAL